VSTAERRQQDFDRVWQHFVVNQGRPGFQGGSCALKTQDGAYCANNLIGEPERLRCAATGCLCDCAESTYLGGDSEPFLEEK